MSLSLDRPRHMTWFPGGGSAVSVTPSASILWSH